MYQLTIISISLIFTLMSLFSLRKSYIKWSNSNIKPSFWGVIFMVSVFIMSIYFAISSL